MWRAIHSPLLHAAFYLSIITWETISSLLCWWGGFRMAQALRDKTAEFQQAKRISIAALTLSLLLWLVVFQAVGGEWFLMWQSKTWNGLGDAFRMFTVVGIVLLLAAQPDSEDQP